MRKTLFTIYFFSGYILFLGLFMLNTIPSRAQNIYIVSQAGDADFTSIQEAVNAAEDQSSIIISPGIYEEYIEIYDKSLSLIGTSMNDCIIKADSSNYYQAPVEIGAGMLKNLTIYGYVKESCEVLQGVALDDFDLRDLQNIRNVQSLFPGYAIHIDQDYSYNHDLTIENCKIISDSNQCLGIGTRGNSSLNILNTQLIAEGTGGCIFLHNCPSSGFGGATNIFFQNVTMKNYKCPYILSFTSYESDNNIRLTYENVRAYTVAFESKSSYQPSNMNTCKNVDELLLLQNTGEINKIVNDFTPESSKEYMLAIASPNISLFERIKLEEGISYIKNCSLPKCNEQERLMLQPELEYNQRSIINIYNYNKETGNGWCGLNSFELTPDSFGNTLPEMNY